MKSANSECPSELFLLDARKNRGQETSAEESQHIQKLPVPGDVEAEQIMVICELPDEDIFVDALSPSEETSMKIKIGFYIKFVKS